MDFFNNHKKLYGTALGAFIGLTIVVAIMPALRNQDNNAPLPNAVPLNEQQMKGKHVFISEGCVACHTQQVRNVDMDKTWGSRPGIPADYASNTRTDVWRNTATLMGTERIGPDLTNIGNRQPAEAWHLVHLYQPRAVAEKSIMPAYPWLFEVKSELGPNDVEITVPDKYRRGISGKIVATKDALNLVAYMQSLKQVPLGTGTPLPEFLYKKEEQAATADKGGKNLPEGKAIYTSYCQSCHQENGEGLKGAFPPLKGSPITTGEDLDLYVTIIMNGYDARPEFATMPGVGTINNFTAEQVTALINYEKTSWGNNAKPVNVEDVQKAMDQLKITAKK